MDPITQVEVSRLLSILKFTIKHLKDAIDLEEAEVIKSAWIAFAWATSISTVPRTTVVRAPHQNVNTFHIKCIAPTTVIFKTSHEGNSMDMYNTTPTSGPIIHVPHRNDNVFHLLLFCSKLQITAIPTIILDKAASFIPVIDANMYNTVNISVKNITANPTPTAHTVPPLGIEIDTIDNGDDIPTIAMLTIADIDLQDDITPPTPITTTTEDKQCELPNLDSINESAADELTVCAIQKYHILANNPQRH
ncbi:hypothetical protein A0H81_02832 [Grifola frondosa]|uniref:Uncharacterized protein n=1 Tax=Grifola frondosa TaxID=5627 RepID=A0A1C7MLY1_GRIFR|nr:hypothetical protein A0H81_02832 [Grifola frondosa]